MLGIANNGVITGEWRREKDLSARRRNNVAIVSCTRLDAQRGIGRAMTTFWTIVGARYAPHKLVVVWSTHPYRWRQNRETSSLPPTSSLGCLMQLWHWMSQGKLMMIGSKYLKSLRLEMRLHKHIHIHKDIWAMLGVRWSHALLAFIIYYYLIVFLLFFVHTNNLR